VKRLREEGGKVTTRVLKDKKKREELRLEFYGAISSGKAPAISEVVRTLRRLHGLTRAAFAMKAGISEESLKRIEQGRANPTLETLERLLALGSLTLTVRVLTSEELVDRRNAKIRAVNAAKPVS
jgi:DNA-binding XRE family transcriptional regulator